MTSVDLLSTASSTRAMETPTLIAAGALLIKLMSKKTRLSVIQMLEIFYFHVFVLNVLFLTTRGQHSLVFPFHSTGS